MKRLIEVKVDGSHITKDHGTAGVQGEANSTTLRIEFDESWDSLAKTVTWWNAKGQNQVKRILTADLLENIEQSTRVYLTTIPAEPLAEAGMCTFVIDGYVDGKRQRSFSDRLKVTAAPIANNAAEPADPTPTQAEQLQVQMDSVLTDIQRAIEVADTADEARQTATEALAAADRAEELMKTGTHAARHQRGGDDPLTPDMIGAVPKEVVIPVGDDLNWYTCSGFYRLSTSHGNMPTGCDYGQMIVVHGGGDTVTQICIAYSNTAFMRSGNPLSPSGGWSGWREIEFADKTVKKTGDYMSGRLHVPQLAITDYGSPLEGPQFIDFHVAGSVKDYDARLEIDAYGEMFFSKYGYNGNRVLHTGNVTKGTTELTEGVSALTDGCIHLVYE